IDKSDTRRGRPSMHKMFNQNLTKRKDLKFSGEDLAIVAGDVMYAMSMLAFLSIKENLQRKELAFKKLMEAAFFTGSGEFIEILFGLNELDRIEKKDIYKIYDYKTANYTFASPLAIGATLAGAKKSEVDKLFNFGIYLGRAFQIKDDILGMFSEEAEIGKSILSDLQEAKKTILIWYAFNHSNNKDKQEIKQMLSKGNIDRADLLKMREIMKKTGSLDYAKNEVNLAIENAKKILNSSRMLPRYKEMLSSYYNIILGL
ncbi:MAG: polyprenyl synthetase family protein, partial [Candidatus Omnitrophica bacterium]|nr:polyprenyl synthetase family protein [Candidatus Omnitrophota bacterium]